MDNFIGLANKIADHLHLMRVAYVHADDPQVKRHATWIRELAEQLGGEEVAPTPRRIEWFNEYMRREAERRYPGWKIRSVTLYSGNIWTAYSGVRTHVEWSVSMGQDTPEKATLHVMFELRPDGFLSVRKSEMVAGEVD